MSNWYDMLKEEMKYRGDAFPPVCCTLSEDQLRVEFDDSYGGVEGQSFTAWGEKWVYFPICYDGSESVGSAPRNPCDISLDHQGG